MAGCLIENGKLLQAQFGDRFAPLDVVLEAVESGRQKRLEPRVQTGCCPPSLIQGLSDPECEYAHTVGIFGSRDLLQAVAHRSDEKLHPLQSVIGCGRADQSASRRGAVLGTERGVADRVTQLRDLAVGDLKPGCEQPLALGVYVERIAQMASFQLADGNAISDQLVKRFKVDSQTTDGRSHRAECNTVSAAVLEAYQSRGERLYLGSNPLGPLDAFGGRRRREQRRGGRDDPLGLPRDLLRCQGCRHSARSDSIENLTNLPKRVDRDACADYRKTADPQERQQQSTCHAKPDRIHRTRFR